MFEDNGYSTETLMKDFRFKVGLRLREAGLSGTDYARHVMSHTKPSAAPRTDMKGNHLQSTVLR